VRPADVDELDRGDPGEVALENALRKARAARALGTEAAETGAEVVLGCDTLVALDGTIYGKPGDEAEARATLRALSGATHEVFSGLVLLFGDGREQRTALVRTAVTFRELEEGTLDWAALVRAVEGDYENVVGLPLARLLDIYPDLLHEGRDPV